MEGGLMMGTSEEGPWRGMGGGRDEASGGGIARGKPLARNGKFFKNAVINIFFTVTSKMAQLHIFRGLWFTLA